MYHFRVEIMTAIFQIGGYMIRMMKNGIVLMFLLLATTSCINLGKSSPQEQEIKTATINTQSDYVIAHSLSEIIEKAQLILVGKVVGMGEIINLARDVNDPSIPDPSLFGIGQIYDVEVVEVLKSAQSEWNISTIHIVQFEGRIRMDTTLNPSNDDIQKARELENVPPLDLGTKYIFFVDPIIDFKNYPLHFSGRGLPWRFVIKNNCVYPEAPTEEVGRYFVVQPVDEFINQIKIPTLIKILPTDMEIYPAPNKLPTSSLCPQLDTILYSYP